ncbi:MAG: hypothetical protein HY926_02840 [Elusimicrobia bacterium]|nr:hypothetical protein [Elusimicrobiota bacterium]
MTQSARFFDDKKFMWDGKVYEGRSEAEESERGYRKDAFETRVVEDGGKFLVYSRRVAAQQTAVEG